MQCQYTGDVLIAFCVKFRSVYNSIKPKEGSLVGPLEKRLEEREMIKRLQFRVLDSVPIAFII